MGDNTTLMFFIMLVALVAYAAYEVNKVKSKIHCTFIRPDRTKIEKWAKEKQRRVDFDNGWYYIAPKRIVLAAKDTGIFKLFPTKIQTLIFKWDSPMPLDPTTFQNNWETPEARKALDKTEDIIAYSHGNVQAIASKPKKGLLENLMPIISVAAILIIGYMLYTLNNRIDMLGQAINVLQQMLVGGG